MQHSHENYLQFFAMETQTHTQTLHNVSAEKDDDDDEIKTIDFHIIARIQIQKIKCFRCGTTQHSNRKTWNKRATHTLYLIILFCF